MPPPDTKRWGYADIAAELERRIDTGILGVGALLPSEEALSKDFGVARNTVRRALDELRLRGRVRTERTRGTVVRARAPQRVIGMDRYRRDLEAAQQATYPPVQPPPDETLAGHLPIVDITEVAADERLAALFAVDPGTPLSRRHLVHRIAGQPVQITTSYFLLSLVAGTWVVTPGSEPCPGGQIGQLHALGVQVARVVEEVTARYPTTSEAETLHLDGGHVLAITRRMMTADGQVVEVGREIVLPSEGSRLEYSISL